MDLLVRSGQVRRRSGRYVASDSAFVDTGIDRTRKQGLQAFWGRTALERMDDEGQTGSFNLFTIAERDLVELRELHAQFFEQMRSLIARSKTNERIALATRSGLGRELKRHLDDGARAAARGLEAPAGGELANAGVDLGVVHAAGDVGEHDLAVRADLELHAQLALQDVVHLEAALVAGAHLRALLVDDLHRVLEVARAIPVTARGAADRLLLRLSRDLGHGRVGLGHGLVERQLLLRHRIDARGLGGFGDRSRRRRVLLAHDDPQAGRAQQEHEAKSYEF
jgi:hypothetical protein